MALLHAGPIARLFAPIVFGLLLVGSMLPASAAGAATPDAGAIDAYVERAMREARIPGLSLTIVDREGAIHARGFGEADGSGRSVTPQTPFFLASVTKTFTAIIILQLAEEGRLALDDPVQWHVPWFAVADDEHSGKITIRHLLTNRAGLPVFAEGEYDRIFATPTPGDIEREVRLLKSVELAFEPGEGFQYSNVGWTTLALVIETVTGAAYEEQLQARVFDPLDMPRSYSSKAKAEADGLASGHRSWFGFPFAHDWSYSRAGVGGGFTMSTGEDLGHVLQMELNEGTYNGTQLLLPSSVHLLHDPVSILRPDPARVEYAHGSHVRTMHGERVVSHTGAAPNWRAEAMALPGKGLGVVVLMNGNNELDSRAVDAIPEGIVSILLGHEPAPLDRSLGFYPTLGAILVIGDALLLTGAILAAIMLRRRARSIGSRLGRTSPIVAFGALWAFVALSAIPTFIRWPIRMLWFSMPDFALILVTSAIVALVAVVIAISALVRGRAPSRAG